VIKLFCGILFLSACVSATPQADRLLSEIHSVPITAQIAEVPFIPQSTNYCGPATLTMALNWAGESVSLEELAPQVYTPGMNGTLPIDMLSAARRQGVMAIPITGLQDLFLEINAGNPVIVFENLALSWLPQWHYALVFGYDLTSEKVLMHSGPEAFKQWDLRKFERSWKLGDYWGLVVLKPGKLSASADEITHVKAAAALEKLGKEKQAETAYNTILARWPQSLIAKLGRANIAYSKKDFTAAVEFLRQASREHPGSQLITHNLLIAEKALQKASQ
jgi:hypothetical protein